MIVRDILIGACIEIFDENNNYIDSVNLTEWMIALDDPVYSVNGYVDLYLSKSENDTVYQGHNPFDHNWKQADYEQYLEDYDEDQYDSYDISRDSQWTWRFKNSIGRINSVESESKTENQSSKPVSSVQPTLKPLSFEPKL